VAWGLLVSQIMVVVLWSLSRQDEDLLDACPSGFGWSDEFRKAPPANVIVHLMPGVFWIGWYSVMRTYDFIPTV
jgi:hypothetical protein